MTLDERLAHYDRCAEKAYARCLRDFKARKSEIIGELRALVMEAEDDKPEHWLDYHNLHRAELEHFAGAVASRLAKIRRGWT